MREFGVDRRFGFRLRVVVAVAALLGLALVALALPRSARANYFVQECTSAQPGAVDPYLISAGSFNIGFSNECASGQGYGLRLDAHGKSGPGGRLVWQVSAPGGTIFKTTDVDVHYGTDDGYGPAMATASGDTFRSTAGQGPTSGRTSNVSNTDHFGIWLMCWPTDRSCTSTWAYAWTRNLIVEVQDLVAPRVSASGGASWTAGPSMASSRLMWWRLTPAVACGQLSSTSMASGQEWFKSAVPMWVARRSLA